MEDNKLIAEFMGKRHLTIKPLYNYKGDWNLLMPVIDKLKEVVEEPEELDSLKDVLWWGTIKDVYKEVVDCIKTLNQ